jgi:ubiquinone/menaquinone biosynthesis C-methylase UbiE
MTTSRQIQSTAADFWNQWQSARNLNQSQYVDWGGHPTILALVYNDLFGSPSTSVFDYLKQAYPNFSNSTVLSLCAGDGSFEKVLLAEGVFGSITGIDIASERVATANAQAAELEGRLKFIVGDVNEGEFGEASYDVVFAKAALHHVEQLESIFSGIRRCLKPGGKLVTIDFFGPTRFQWSDVQLAAVNHFIDTAIPSALLMRADGSL